MALLTVVAEGGSLGRFLVKFSLTDTTLDSLVTLDTKLLPAWQQIVVRLFVLLLIIDNVTRTFVSVVLRPDGGKYWNELILFGNHSIGLEDKMCEN